jgi:hypothetical protein
LDLFLDEDCVELERLRLPRARRVCDWVARFGTGGTILFLDECALWVATTPAKIALGGIWIDGKGGAERFSDIVLERETPVRVECPVFPYTLVPTLPLRVLNSLESGTSNPEKRICRTGADFWSYKTVTREWGVLGSDEWPFWRWL